MRLKLFLRNSINNIVVGNCDIYILLYFISEGILPSSDIPLNIEIDDKLKQEIRDIHCPEFRYASVVKFGLKFVILYSILKCLAVAEAVQNK